MSVRSRRAARIRAAMDFAQELADYTRQAHEGATFHIDRETFTAQWYATGVSQTRDSDALDESNWQVVSGDLLERFPDSFEIHHFGHWACGWYDRLYVRADDAFALLALQKWGASATRMTLIADEEHYSALEWERNHPTERECYSDDADCGCDYNQHQRNLTEQHAEYAAQNPEEIDADDFTIWCDICGGWWDVPPSGISRYFNENRQELSWGTLYSRDRWINGKRYRFIRQTAKDGRMAVGCRVHGDGDTIIRSAPLHMWANFASVTNR